MNENDEGTELELKKYEFIKRNQYKNKIVEIIKEYIEINNQKYYLKGLICTPTFNHFTALIITLSKNVFNLKEGFSYYYDGNSNNHEIIVAKDIASILEEDLPYIALYSNV